MSTKLLINAATPLNIAYDEDSATFYREKRKIELPISGSIDEGYHEYMAYYINRILDEVDEIFGKEYIHPFFISEAIYGCSRVLYSNEKFLNWRNDLVNNSNADDSIGTARFRARKLDNKNHTLFDIDFRGTYFYVRVASPIIRNFASGANGVVTDANVYFSADEFLSLMRSMKESIATTFSLAKQELTSVKQQKFVSLLFEDEIFKNPIVKQIIGLTPNTQIIRDPKLALLASKGYDASMLKLFYVYKYFPSYAELEDINTLPLEWIVNVLSGKS